MCLALLVFLLFLQFGALKGFIPEHCIFKADQWLQLTRTHAKAVLTLANRVEGNLLHLFKKVACFMFSLVWCGEV